VGSSPCSCSHCPSSVAPQASEASDVSEAFDACSKPNEPTASKRLSILLCTSSGSSRAVTTWFVGPDEPSLDEDLWAQTHLALSGLHADLRHLLEQLAWRDLHFVQAGVGIAAESSPDGLESWDVPGIKLARLDSPGRTKGPHRQLE
jgi:hypothetical protein